MALSLHFRALFNHFKDSIEQLNALWNLNDDDLSVVGRDFETKQRLIDGVIFHIDCKE